MCDLSSVCEGCPGTGIRSPADPSCAIDGVDLTVWTIVERCDMCERFDDDLAAAKEVFATTRWVECKAGGWHAVGRDAKGAVSPVTPDAEQKTHRAVARPRQQSR
jgi:hypothetical protein